ncbi:sodium/glutamate symporter [Luminiphilus sp.]|nr:sodium/glutamate symporter [Luminiphilus sp.]MDB3923485.1 sodium/glutamate symporter [Luminiphilus sp.]
MEAAHTVWEVDTFLAVTIGIVVLFLGKRINRLIPVFGKYSIPEPVTGGLFIAIILFAIHSFADISIEFELGARDALLIYFFTTIGINASFKDLAAGGKPLALLLLVTVIYMVTQNLTGIGMASVLGLEPAVGLLGGTVSLIGGHGTAIAWAPRFAENYGIGNAMEIGIACATFGLVLASLIGGPVAKFLVSRHQLVAGSDDDLDVGIDEEADPVSLNYMELLDAVLALHICIIIGYFLDVGLSQLGVHLPLFVSCLFAGIIMTNLRPNALPRITGTQWPSRTPAMALIADISLGTFLAMSLMSMQLWEVIDLAGALFSILGAQVIVAVIFMIFVVFPMMGKNYEAAVIASGFGGFSMGATPTAMANMSAVTQRYGPCHQAFIIVPLVGAFFIDVTNAILIQLMFGWL